MHQIGFIYKFFWDVTSRRLVVVPSSGSSSPGRMDFYLTSWPEVNEIWASETSVNIYQLAKRNIPEGLRTFCNTAVKAENCYMFCYIFFAWMPVQSLAHSNSHIWRQYPAVAILQFVRKRPRYLIWESSNMLVRVEVTFTWVRRFHRL